MRAATIAELAVKNDVESPVDRRRGWVFDSFDDFLAQYDQASTCLTELDDFRRIALELCEDLAADGTRHAEITFTLEHHALRLNDWQGPLDAVLDGLKDGAKTHDVTWGVVLDHARQLDPKLAVETALVAARYAARGVVAMGLGGDERFPPQPFTRAFAIAREAGLKSVPHAGEVLGPNSVRDALDYLHADRIGHGIRALESSSLTAELVHRAIPLEVCVTSNVATKVVRSLAAHPIRRLVHAGLVIAPSSDDPAMFDAWLSNDYENLRNEYGFGDDDLAALASNSVSASFTSPQRKKVLLDLISAWLEAPADAA